LYWRGETPLDCALHLVANFLLVPPLKKTAPANFAGAAVAFFFSPVNPYDIDDFPTTRRRGAVFARVLQLSRATFLLHRGALFFFFPSPPRRVTGTGKFLVMKKK